MYLTFQYQLRLSPKQHDALERILEGERCLYNAAMTERREAWKRQKISISLYDQMKSLTEIRSFDPDFGDLPATLSRWTLQKVDLAFKAFFERCKTKASKAGFPRYKGKGRWKSFGFKEFSGIRFLEAEGKTWLSVKVFPGDIRVNLHRLLPAQSTIKSAVFTKTDKGWILSLQLEIPDFIGPHSHANRMIGIDAGVAALATLDSGETIENIRPYAQSQRELRIVQRKLSRSQKGSNSRRKTIRHLRAVHRKIANRRKNHLNQASARLTRSAGTIFIEDLRLKNLTASAKGDAVNPGKNVRQKAGLNRVILDASIGNFFHMLRYKAEKAGGVVIEVNARRTSIECSFCHASVPKTLSARVHRCPRCGLTMDRDRNAAVNILQRGQIGLDLRDGC